MTISRAKLAKVATITIDCEPEHARIRGNASAIDEQTDRRIAESIERDLADGNQWAWCTVGVYAHFAGLSGVTYLGCCSYADEEGFKTGGYFEQMCEEALDELHERLQAIADEIEAVL